jgi:hypothetical protein
MGFRAISRRFPRGDEPASDRGRVAHLARARWAVSRRALHAGRAANGGGDVSRAGLLDGGTYTFYIWARGPSGTRKISLAIVNNAYAAYLAGPTQVTLTTSWQRLKITGTLAAGQTGLWIVVRQYAGNNDDWTTGDIHLWGACLQQGDDPHAAYARTWATQTQNLASGIATGPTVIAAPDTTTSPLRIHGPGSNLADSTLLELTANGELILAGGSGNGYRFAELMAASNPSGWSGVLKVKTPAGTTLGYILLYTTP